MDQGALDLAENRRRMLAGELYYAGAPDLSDERNRCRNACWALTLARYDGAPRRKLVELWKEIVQDDTPLPPPGSPEEEAALKPYPWVDGVIRFDYGYQCKFGPGVYLNANCTFVDTCTITIGARTLVGPNCSFYSGTHPLDPFLRDGLKGPEAGKPIVIGEDCWLGGNVVVCPGVTIGRGVTVGAGSVVTRDVEDFVVVAGNPARVIRRLELEERKEQGESTA
ncbi:maltose O-acetyltransferase [Corynascus novoguineensis]|uniref:Maltose O-acetyltransferase n=1 Tax=Corynascus novoguineensis TaxID=1126955 RepID=A0AAN7CLX1_9PEZI|nr:maltose O-acetyltransferase [Corynascus novoguineensis]